MKNYFRGFSKKNILGNTGSDPRSTPSSKGPFPLHIVSFAIRDWHRLTTPYITKLYNLAQTWDFVEFGANTRLRTMIPHILWRRYETPCDDTTILWRRYETPYDYTAYTLHRHEPPYDDTTYILRRPETAYDDTTYTLAQTRDCVRWYHVYFGADTRLRTMIPRILWRRHESPCDDTTYTLRRHET
jgi:hypothetical protein